MATLSDALQAAVVRSTEISPEGDEIYYAIYEVIETGVNEYDVVLQGYSAFEPSFPLTNTIDYKWNPAVKAVYWNGKRVDT